jgi:hypothetical protein
MPVEPHETLFLSHRKRFVPAYVPGAAGDELHLYCGLQEITFDEPELFPWAEKLITQESFEAKAATTWAVRPLEWLRVRDLLEALLDEEIIVREPPEKSVSQLPLSEAHLQFVEAEKARPAPPRRFWSPAVLQEITGRELEAGYFEAVVPVHRIAHPAVDLEGRQVGEMNVFPEALRLKLATDWKTCNYAGSRFRDEQPMNMTALRSMLAHWKPVLRATLAVREEFLTRYPLNGRWKLGELHFLSSAVLALPAFQLMRAQAPVPNGQLDPVLSSLFRVVDGVRMVTNHMLDLPEWQLTHDHLVSARDVTGAAERENQYLSTRGVCAGPQNMIDELVATLMEGKPAETVPLGTWAKDIPAAVDYALRGLQVFAAVQSIWIQVGLVYARIHEAGAPEVLREALARDWTLILPGRFHLPEQRAWSERYYRTMFERAQTGIRGMAPGDRQDLRTLLTPPPGLLEDRAALAGMLGPARDIAVPLLDYLRFERNALKTVTSLLRQIDTLLGRPHPRNELTGNQFAIHHLLRKGTPGAMPYLMDTLRETLGVSIDNRPGATTVAAGNHFITLQ